MELATEDFWGRGQLAICRAVLTHRPKDHLKKKSATLPRKSPQPSVLSSLYYHVHLVGLAIAFAPLIPQRSDIQIGRVEEKKRIFRISHTHDD